jgi:murein DD-endopeptidase MepM/ murein hydrolase activator NlpD
MAALVIAAVLAGCSAEPQYAAPVILKGPGQESAVENTFMPTPLAPPRPEPQGRRIVVQRGQSLSRIAHQLGVPQHDIIAANHLKPPYKIETGQHLLIPGGAASRAPHEPPAAVAAAAAPEVIPLDGPPPAKPSGAHPVAAKPEKPAKLAAAEPHRSGEDAAALPKHVAKLPHGGHFPWPVRGHVVAGYGAARGGGRNDGINIAAPRGAPVRAIEEGVVAYSGNEVRGYGNLVLIKHPDGFITAYAHCDELLVKRGEKVGKGQVIAKVGATGGVSEPQLHFELRRGRRAVDPREFLTPAPSADAAAPKHRG